MIIYNLFPLLAGPCRAWAPHLQRAAEMGFDWIFVNPIQKPGFSGSLYSIVDYFALNPLLGEAESNVAAKAKTTTSPPSSASSSIEKDLRAAIATANRLGMRVMVDLVINHCAIDAKLTREHPEWFVKENGKIANPYCIDNGEKVVWGDLALFDHRHTSDPEGLYRYFAKIVEYLIDLGFSGFRCDAAYQIPGNIWRRLMHETRSKHPNTVFVAETLGCTAEQTKQTAEAGFDFIFNSSKYWDFHASWLLEQYQLIREIARSISFPESHDTERLFQEVNGNLYAMKQRYLFAAMFSAGVMMPMGFEYGFKRRMHVVETRPKDWESPNAQLTDFVKTVNRLKAGYAIFNEECPTMVLPYDNPNILLMWKASAKTKDESLIILNKDVHNHQHFYAENIARYVQAGGPLRDVSPEYPLDFIPKPFDYSLRPGQGFVFVASRDHPPLET
ncbi:MAG: alpha-amylase [Deltaproteobacteria bacterium]|nr:alpha-amylase [Deltaproteobacteria bacterium]